MTPIERQHLEYLKREKDTLVDNFIGACEEINRQIKDVKSGEWLRQMQEGKSETKCRECKHFNGEHACCGVGFFRGHGSADCSVKCAFWEVKEDKE